MFDRFETATAINIALELFGSVMVLIGVMSMFFTVGADKTTKKHILVAYFFTFVAVLFDAIAWLLSGLDGNVYRAFIFICAFLGAVGTFGSTVFYADYIAFDIGKYTALDTRKMRICYYVLGGVMAAVLVASQFVGFLYFVDDDNVLHTGEYVWLNAVFSGAVSLVTIFILILARKKLNRRDIVEYLLYALIPVSGAIVQIFFGGLMIEKMAFLMLMTVILLRIQSATLRDVKAKDDELLSKQKEVADLNDKILLGQVGPHFIYNSLTAIQMIDGNPPETVKAIDDFAKYLRGNLSVLESERNIPFEQELAHIKTYLDIEKLRFGNEIEVEFEIEDKGFLLPALSVQMLVENAVKHGVTKKRGGGKIIIKTERAENEHIILVQDDGVGFDVDKQIEDGHYGIVGNRKRLEHFVNGTLDIESEVGKGTTAVIKIPFEKK